MRRPPAVFRPGVGSAFWPLALLIAVLDWPTEASAQYGVKYRHLLAATQADTSSEGAGKRRSPPGSRPLLKADPGPDSAPPLPASYGLPNSETLWPSRGTRGMGVLLVGPGVHQAKTVRFGSIDAEIIAREESRVRLRVPMLPAGYVPVTVVYELGMTRLKALFDVLESPLGDAGATAVPPCDGRPEPAEVSVEQLKPSSVRPGQRLKISGRRLDNVSHVTFTVAQHEVDSRLTGVNPELIGIDFSATGRPRTAPRWLDLLSTEIGRPFGARPSVAGECDPTNLSAYAAARHFGDSEIEVCVPSLAISGPIGFWRHEGPTGDSCETSLLAVHVRRNPAPR